MALLDGAIVSLANQSVDSLDCLGQHVSNYEWFGSPRLDRGLRLGRRALLSFEPLLFSGLVAANNGLFQRLDIVLVPNVLGLTVPFVDLVAQSKIRTASGVQSTFRSVAIAVLRQRFAPWIGSVHDVKLVVVRSSSDGTRNPDVNFRGEKRSNETHRSTTDPDARLAKKARGKESKLSYQANVLMENRNGLIVDTQLLHSTGTAECEAALAMLDRLPKGKRRRTLGADKCYDTCAFVAGVRARGVTPHVAQNTANRRSAIDGRTTRHGGYAVSQKKRKLVEQGFGWKKSVGLLRKLRHRGIERVEWIYTFTSAAFNLVRMRSLLLEAVSP